MWVIPTFIFLLLISLSVSHFIDKSRKRRVTSAPAKKALWIPWNVHKCSMHFKILFQSVPLILLSASISNCILTVSGVFRQLAFCHKMLEFLNSILVFFLVPDAKPVSGQLHSFGHSDIVYYHVIKALLHYLSHETTPVVSTPE